MSTRSNRTCTFLFVLLTIAASSSFAQTSPSTVNNDDSCDIGVYPAATLLLPYFEVDVAAARSRTTTFSITNVSPQPQIARVTLWTDFAYPVLTFNIFLTGYDVQAINLYDVIVRGVIGSPTGTSTAAPNARYSDGTSLNPPFALPATNLANPNFLPQVVDACAPGKLPGNLPPPLVQDVISLLTKGTSAAGTSPCGNQKAGGQHADIAIGYATIDVVATCSSKGPTDAGYFTGELLFDNVLIGEYDLIGTESAGGSYAGGSPMVHIRAVPEGGGVGSLPTGVTNLPFTFYDRYTMGLPDRRFDRRQPLPSTFAARVEWDSSTSPDELIVWRESFVTKASVCPPPLLPYQLSIKDLITFDERENASTLGNPGLWGAPLPGLPASSKTPASSFVFPQIVTTDDGGWRYLDLSNGGDYAAPGQYSASRTGFTIDGQPAGARDVSQNWVVISKHSSGRHIVLLDALSLGNGCSRPVVRTTSSDERLGPTGGVVVCPPGTLPTNGDRTACTGTNINP